MVPSNRVFTNCAGAAPGSASSGDGSLVLAAPSHSAGDVLESSCGAAVPTPADAASSVRVSILTAHPFVGPPVAGVPFRGSVGPADDCGGDGDGFSAAGAASDSAAGVSAPTGKAFPAGGTVAPGSGDSELLAGAMETG